MGLSLNEFAVECSECSEWVSVQRSQGTVKDVKA